MTAVERIMARARALAACSYEEAHLAHVEVNGECPWCGYVEDEE